MSLKYNHARAIESLKTVLQENMFLKQQIDNKNSLEDKTQKVQFNESDITMMKARMDVVFFNSNKNS